MPLPGLAPCFLSGKVLSLKLCPWPPVYNNNGSRLILPRNLLKNRALAGDLLAIYSRIALSPDTSSQFIQAQRPRHSEIALSLGTSLRFITESRSRLILPHNLFRRSALDTQKLRPGRRRRRSPVRPSRGRVAAGQRCRWPGRWSAAAPSLARARLAGSKYVPPEGGTIEDEEGGYRGFGKDVLDDTRADKSEQS